MFSFLASGIKKHYEIGETLGQYVIFNLFDSTKEAVFRERQPDLGGCCYRGSFAVVKVGIPKKAGEGHVAIKIIDKKVSCSEFAK
jgi:hypothetical protein